MNNVDNKFIAGIIAGLRKKPYGFFSESEINEIADYAAKTWIYANEIKKNK